MMAENRAFNQALRKHVNTYNNFDLGTRFGLFGIPTLIFFKGDKRLGRISPLPGTEPFFEALMKLAKGLQ
jgi:hypothetical protein